MHPGGIKLKQMNEELWFGLNHCRHRVCCPAERSQQMAWCYSHCGFDGRVLVHPYRMNYMKVRDEVASSQYSWASMMVMTRVVCSLSPGSSAPKRMSWS